MEESLHPGPSQRAVAGFAVEFCVREGGDIVTLNSEVGPIAYTKHG